MTFKQKIKLYAKQYFPALSYKILGWQHSYYYERNKLIDYLQIDTFFDVGANLGQYAHSLRNFGYKNKIISFEPLSSAFEMLNKRAKADGNWSAFNYGLGDQNQILPINISQNSVSSSLLESNAVLLNLEPNTRFVSKENVTIKRLDSVWDDFVSENSKVFVKIDVQGYESKVIEGCGQFLNKISGFQLELSFNELYQDERTFFEMNDFMNKIGFKLVKIEPGWIDPITGFAVEVDGIFVRK